MNERGPRGPRLQGRRASPRATAGLRPVRLPAEEGKRRLRVLVVDDHDVVHWGFRLMLAEQPWVERCLSARTGAEAVALTGRYEPHVALVDLFVGEESGAEICEGLCESSPGTRVLLISGAGRISPSAARAAGASGFVPKEWPAQEIAQAVQMVARGMTVFRDVAQPPANRPSGREREVLALMASGATNREIADALHLSPWTVKEYTGALYRKLEVRNRAEAVQRAQRLGLLD
ncbi:MAG TPA: response regulator transcription factor [Solirubrobacteraceae bacterium]|nr:response regulator transcription factor [Solirubrobacteraceae bacterium]